MRPSGFSYFHSPDAATNLTAPVALETMDLHPPRASSAECRVQASSLSILPVAAHHHCLSGRFYPSTLLPQKSRQGGIRLTAGRPAGVTLTLLGTGAIAWLAIIPSFPGSIIFRLQLIVVAM
jgi:hypothetical protein